MNKETLINQTLESYHDRINELIPEIDFKLDNQKNHIGFNYKYIIRGKSHHWISFGIIHHPKLEFWFNIGTTKYEDDFNSMKETLLKIKEEKGEFQILEKKGQFFIRAGVIFEKLEEDELKKGLENILDVAKYALKELEGTGFLGLDFNTTPTQLNAKKLICTNCHAELEFNNKFCSNCVEELWSQKKYDLIKEKFESLYSWEQDILKEKKYTEGNIVYYYLYSLFQIDSRERESFLKTKDFLNTIDFFEENKWYKLFPYKDFLWCYAQTAMWLEEKQDIIVAKKKYEIINEAGESLYNNIIEKLQNKLNEMEKEDRFYFKIHFICKTKSKTKNPLFEFDKGTIVKGYFHYLTNSQKLTKESALNVLYSELTYLDDAVKFYFNNKIVHPDVKNWSDVTTPFITDIELLGMESEFENPKIGPGNIDWF